MRLTLAALLALTIGACGADDEATPATVTTTTEAESYPAFDTIDPDTHAYFIALEDDDLQASSDELVWDAGVSICESMDAGATVDEELTRVQDDLGFTAAPSMIASAASHICDQHEQAIEDYANG